MTLEAEKSPVLKALRLLSHVARSREPVPLAEISRELGLPKPTSHRLARMLEQAGYVHKDPLTRRYLVGARFEDVALSALRHGAGHGARHQLMDELAQRICARINIAVLKSGKLLSVEWVESTSPLRIDLQPETQIPVHCSASGKLLLAFGPDALREGFLRSAPFKAHTKRTLTTAPALGREFAQIRRRGYAEDNEEFLQGVCCLAVPIRNARGDVVAGLAAMAPAMQLSMHEARKHVSELHAYADRIAAGFVQAKDAARAVNGAGVSAVAKSKKAPNVEMKGRARGRKPSEGAGR